MVQEDMDLNEFLNIIEGLIKYSSSNKKIEVVEIVYFLVERRLHSLVFVDVLLLLGDLFVDHACKTGSGVQVEGGIGILVRVEAGTGIVVGVRTGNGVRVMVLCLQMYMT
jgi:hypothetical protein